VEQGVATRHGEPWQGDLGGPTQRSAAGNASGIDGTVRPKAL
jgi:hypothetical protein